MRLVNLLNVTASRGNRNSCKQYNLKSTDRNSHLPSNDVNVLQSKTDDHHVGTGT